MKLIPTNSLAARLFAAVLAATLAFTGTPVAAFAEDIDVTAVPDVAIEEVAVAEEAPVFLTADASVTATITVEAVGDDGVASAWVPATTISVPDGTDAMTATQQVLDAAGLSYDIQWGFLNAITSAYGETLETAADYSVYWQFLVNGAYSNVGAGDYTLAAGDSIIWHFGAANEPTNPEGPDYDTATAPSDVDVEWARFEDNGNVTDAPTATEAVEEWRTRVGGASGASDLVIADGNVFIAIGTPWDPTSPLATYAMQLVKIDAASGEIVATTPLAGDIDYTCRPIVWGGLIYIPLHGGSVQAVNVKTMKTYWVSAAAEDNGQSTTSLAIYNVDASTGEYDENWNPVFEKRDLLFEGTAVYDSGTGGYSRGSIVAIDALTGTVHSEWAYSNYSAGFYWTNTLELDGHIIAADTAGAVHVLAVGSWSGMELGSVALTDRVVADMALYNGDVLVATNDGVLYRIAVNSDGLPSVVSSVRALSNCKSGPVVVGDTCIIGGVEPQIMIKGAKDTSPAAAVAVIDLTTMTVKQLITTADGETLPTGWGNGVCAPVLVSEQDGKTICYFTLNFGVNDPDDPTWTKYSEGGNVYWFELGEDEAHLFYAPEGDVAQYCDSPLIADTEGALYYLNDSGFVVKFAGNKTDEPVDPTPVNPQPTNDTPTNDTPANNGPAQQRGGIPTTGDASVSGVSALVLAAVMMGAAGLLRRKEN